MRRIAVLTLALSLTGLIAGGEQAAADYWGPPSGSFVGWSIYGTVLGYDGNSNPIQHTGLDILTAQASCGSGGEGPGSPVYAIADGTVQWVWWLPADPTAALGYDGPVLSQPSDPNGSVKYGITVDYAGTRVWYWHMGQHYTQASYVQDNIVPGLAVHRGDLLGYQGNATDQGSVCQHLHVTFSIPGSTVDNWTNSMDLSPYIGMNVNVASGTHVQNDGHYPISFDNGPVCYSGAFTMDPSYYAPAGTTVTQTGSASCTAGASAQYKWWQLRPGGNASTDWVLVSDWGPNTWWWFTTSTTQQGTWTIGLYIRGVGSNAGYQTYVQNQYTIMAPATVAPATTPPPTTAPTIPPPTSAPTTTPPTPAPTAPPPTTAPTPSPTGGTVLVCHAVAGEVECYETTAPTPTPAPTATASTPVATTPPPATPAPTPAPTDTVVCPICDSR